MAGGEWRVTRERRKRQERSSTQTTQRARRTLRTEKRGPRLSECERVGHPGDTFLSAAARLPLLRLIGRGDWMIWEPGFTSVKRELCSPSKVAELGSGKERALT
jgi:hypothetical protein